jgi:hypothetical protein
MYGFCSKLVSLSMLTKVTFEKTLAHQDNLSFFCKFQICTVYNTSFTIIIYDCNDSTILIYEHNDSGLYYKTTIVTNQTLARSVNYDCRIVRNATN